MATGCTQSIRRPPTPRCVVRVSSCGTTSGPKGCVGTGGGNPHRWPRFEVVETPSPSTTRLSRNTTAFTKSPDRSCYRSFMETTSAVGVRPGTAVGCRSLTCDRLVSIRRRCGATLISDSPPEAPRPLWCRHRSVIVRRYFPRRIRRLPSQARAQDRCDHGPRRRWAGS